jgi:hypothetical protein
VHNSMKNDNVGKRVLVIFNRDASTAIKGRIVCSDSESPADTVIRLDDGRLVDATECQYTYES